MKYLFSLLFCCLSFSIFAQNLTGPELLNKSIAYHDANGQWNQFKSNLHFGELRPDGSERTTVINLDNRINSFVLDQKRGDNQIYRKVVEDDCQILLNGKVATDSTVIKKNRLTCDYSKMIRGYYVYLWGLPMKLKDEGTIVDDRIEKVDFQGKEVWSLKVTYRKDVGKDTWYFYFDLKTYALVGYRFFHVEAENDGEYITLEEEEVVNGIRFPKTRKWYINKDDKFLGTDILKFGK